MNRRPGETIARERHRFRYFALALTVLATLAIVGLCVAWFFFSRWSDLRAATGSEADRAFAEAVEGSGGRPAFLEVAPDGHVLVHRELNPPEPAAIRALNLLAWEPGGGRLVRTAFPIWFVRFKLRGTMNLGTLTAALARDWRNLDLRVTVDDMEKRGPCLVLDQRRPDGARIVLWTD